VPAESLPWSYDRNITWLLEPLNPHAIAATRRNTYTRYTLQTLAQCLLEFGDSEFSRDTSESIARAYVLYSTTLGLLESDDLNPEPPPCDEVIEALKDETSGDFTVAPPGIKDVFSGLIAELYGVRGSLADLTATAADVRLALQSDASLLSRLGRASRIVQAAKYARADLTTVGSVLRATEEHSARVDAILLRHSRVVQALEEVSVVAAVDAEHTMTSLTGQPKEVIRKLDLPWLETNVKTVAIEISAPEWRWRGAHHAPQSCRGEQSAGGRGGQSANATRVLHRPARGVLRATESRGWRVAHAGRAEPREDSRRPQHRWPGAYAAAAWSGHARARRPG